MEHKDINIVRSRLNNYQSPINTTDAWIAYQKNTKAKKVRFLLLRSLVVLGMVSLGVGIWYASTTLNDNNMDRHRSQRNSAKNTTDALIKESDTSIAEMYRSDEANKAITTEEREDNTKTHKIGQNASLVAAKLDKIDINSTPEIQDIVSYESPIKQVIATKIGDIESSKFVKTVSSKETFISPIVPATKGDKASDTIKTTQHKLARNTETKTTGSKSLVDSTEVLALVSNANSNIDSDSIIVEVPEDTIVSYAVAAPINTSINRHSISVAYNYGIKDAGLYFLTTTTRAGGSSTTRYVPHGHQSLVLGYQYKVIGNISFHAGLSGGLGYINGNTSYSSASIGTEQVLNVKQSEWGAEGLALATPINFRRFSTTLGLGGYYRSFNISYETGPNSSADVPTGTLQPSQSDALKTSASGMLAMIRLNYKLRDGNINLGYLHQWGEYSRPSIRLGYTYLFK